MPINEKSFGAGGQSAENEHAADSNMPSDPSHESEDEYLDLVDDDDKVIGKKRRSEVYAEALSNFRVVNAFLVNSNGEMWIPRRTAEKKIFPLALDMGMGEHVKSGENYEQALARGIQEELHLDPSSVKVRELGYLTPQKDGVSSFMKVYEISTDEVPDYDRSDFSEYSWIAPSALSERIAGGEQTKADLPKLVRRFYTE